MQSFLGDYNGSRKDSVFKLNRALESFNNQTNKDTELILVSDNCELTKSVWENNWKSNDSIRFFHLVDDSKKMYQKIEDGIFYRGYPRQIGLELSTGDVVTYMDSDDFILPDYLQVLSDYWESNSNLFWIYNNCWYDNYVVLEKEPFGYFESFEKSIDCNKLKIVGLESDWILSKVKPGRILMSPALISHKRECDVIWEDYIRKKLADYSEDMLFNRRLRQKYKSGGLVSIPGYVRCHLKDCWDI